MQNRIFINKISKKANLSYQNGIKTKIYCNQEYNTE